MNRLAARASMASLLATLALLGLPIGRAHASESAKRYVLMTFWSDNATFYPGFPVPGSLDGAGKPRRNTAFSRALNRINVLAYAFLQVNGAGDVYFSHPRVDLSAQDRRGYCARSPTSCPDLAKASAGSFGAFARLENRRHTLQKIVSIGGAHSQATMDNALDHPRQFVRSVHTILAAYHLDGVDLDFEPNAFFLGNQGGKLAALVASLRSALGPTAFISVEVPADWETLRSIECGGTLSCHDNLAAISRQAYLSLMGYAWHSPLYPGPPLTANDSNLLSDPASPLAAGFYHVSDVQAVDFLTFRGVPARRILLGFPALLKAYGGVAQGGAAYGLYQAFNPGKTRRYDLPMFKGSGTYRMAVKLLQSGFTRHYVRIDQIVSSVYAYNAHSHRWISFEDPVSVAAKARYVRSHGLGGMMMWQIATDMPPGSRLSLLSAAYAALSSRGSVGDRR